MYILMLISLLTLTMSFITHTVTNNTTYTITPSNITAINIIITTTTTSPTYYTITKNANIFNIATTIAATTTNTTSTTRSGDAQIFVAKTKHKIA